MTACQGLYKLLKAETSINTNAQHLSSPLFSIATNPLVANAIHIAPLQVVDTQTGNSSVTFAVDGIEIEVTAVCDNKNRRRDNGS